jgi:hypothetical protein
MIKGDGTWVTHKLALGLVLDSVSKTMQLPPHRVDSLHDFLGSLPMTRTRVSVKTWHNVLGELRSITLGLPGAQGLFSTLLEHLCHLSTKSRLRLITSDHNFLDGFRCLVATLAEHPAKITELLPQAPLTIGASDASGK